ncbi:MAG: methionine--tRNA ligase [Candidatus Moranbacteria bacterium]|nr:methionine--tRNA ligase [Candidatus Moranbacteria bacterium]
MQERTENKPFYITTTLPYVNGRPHLGHILEFVQADVLARMARARGDEVIFNVGTDEHGQKIFQKATEESITPQEYCDRMSEHFRIVKETLDVSYTHFIRTTDPHHVAAAQEFWRRCEASGDIYKKQYKTKYCVGCELEKTDSDLDHGKCPDHPNMEIETVDEENYFFRFSKYQDALLKLYDERPDFVVPKNRLVEIRNFVAGGLRDFSISRLATKMSWGIPVPGDEEHVMYVWFDALANYVTTLGWPEDETNFRKFWPGLQIAGKDNLRPQSAMWQAMLLSAGMEPSRQILIHGHVMSGGTKMSKSLGNVISPDELVEKFGKDGTRYLLLSSGNLENDPDITMERLTEKYNADLANGLGNLVSRVLKLSEKLDPRVKSEDDKAGAFPEELAKILDEYRFADATEYVMGLVREANRHIDDEKPWELVKTDMERFDGVMRVLLDRLAFIASALAPLLPETSAKITKALAEGKVEPLFKRV